MEGKVKKIKKKMVLGGFKPWTIGKAKDLKACWQPLGRIYIRELKHTHMYIFKIENLNFKKKTE